jgi:hypothetical protein
VGKPQGKSPLERPRHIWEDGIGMDLRETGWGGWIGSDWLRIETGGELLWIRWWTFGFLRHGISYLHTIYLHYATFYQAYSKSTKCWHCAKGWHFLMLLCKLRDTSFPARHLHR